MTTRPPQIYCGDAHSQDTFKKLVLVVVKYWPFLFCLPLQIDVLEDPLIRNVIILQTVLQEVRHRSAPVYKRLKDIIHEKEKHFYTFTNEHHR